MPWNVWFSWTTWWKSKRSKQYSRPMRLRGQNKDHVDALNNTPNSSSQWTFSQPSWVEHAPVFATIGCSVTDSPPSSTWGFNIILVRRKISRAGGEKKRGTAEMWKLWTPQVEWSIQDGLGWVQSSKLPSGAFLLGHWKGGRSLKGQETYRIFWMISRDSTAFSS